MARRTNPSQSESQRRARLQLFGNREGGLMANQRDELLTVAQVLAALGDVPLRTFYRWRETGKAPNAIRLPNGVNRDAFAAALKDLTHGSTASERRMPHEVLRREVLGHPAWQGQFQERRLIRLHSCADLRRESSARRTAQRSSRICPARPNAAASTRWGDRCRRAAAPAPAAWWC